MGKGGNERQVVHWFVLSASPTVEESGVFQVLEQPDEVYDLPTGTFGFPQGKRVDGW